MLLSLIRMIQAFRDYQRNVCGRCRIHSQRIPLRPETRYLCGHDRHQNLF
jgi:hypothetical protein